MYDEKLESIIDIDPEGRLCIPKPFIDKLGMGSSATVSISGGDDKIVVRPYVPEQEVRPRCLKCGRSGEGISLKVPFCKTCYNQIIAYYIKENNKKTAIP